MRPHVVTVAATFLRKSTTVDKEHRKVVRTYQRQELLPERREAWRVLGNVLDATLNDTPRTVVPLETVEGQRTATVHYPQWGAPRSARRHTSSS